MPKNKCIYLIHGFASAPKYPSDKADVLERVFGLPVKQISYDSGASYHDNMTVLSEQVDVSPLFFVGTSLGAFYASKLADQFYAQDAAMSILLNPCHHPAITLESSIGMNVNFATNASFELTMEAVASYHDISFFDSQWKRPRWILLNMDDELIDANNTLGLYNGVIEEIITFEHGGHRFENITSQEVLEALDRINNSFSVNGVVQDVGKGS